MKLSNYNETKTSKSIISDRLNKLKTIGDFSDYFNSRTLGLKLKANFCYGKLNLITLLHLIKNNDSLLTLFKNSSVSVKEDMDVNSITFVINNIDLLKIDFNTKRIDYKDASYTYANDYVIKKIENKYREVINKNNNPLNKYLDFTDALTRTIINSCWTNYEINILARKLPVSINKIPKAINKNNFTNMKFYINSKANIKDFTLINKYNQKLHCILNNGKYDCTIF